MEARQHLNPQPPVDEDQSYPSLSDLHDHEPKLEFDDTEINEPFKASQIQGSGALDEFAIQEDEMVLPDHDKLESALTEDDFDQLLETSAVNISSANIIKKGSFDILGTDKQGNYVFGIHASKFPEKSEMESFIRDIITKVNKYVENDYSIVYFHQGGITEGHRPSTQTLWSCYKDMGRAYKKNLKKLYVVHPTRWIKILWNCFRPFISVKFSSKLIYYMSLDELHQATGLDLTKLPEDVREFDRKQNPQNYRNSIPNSSPDVVDEKNIPETTQFGVSLKFIIDHSQCLNYIPPIVRQCVDSLSITGMIDTEGIFRRAGNYARVNELKQRVNKGDKVDLTNVDAYVVAGLLKAFFRDLTEPLLTYELYDEIVAFLDWSKEDRPRNVKQILREKLPEANYELFKYLVEFLVKVMECEDLNKMTSSNLAIVFGPNLLWSNITMSLEEVSPINAFIDFVLQNHKDIYMVDIHKPQIPID